MKNQTETIKASDVQTVSAEALAAAPKAPKSITVTLRSGGGPEEFIAVAYKTKSGWRVEGTFYKSKAVKGERRSGARGGTQNFTGDSAKGDAQKALDAMVALMVKGTNLPALLKVKGGWVKPEPKPLGLERKDDAFTFSNLPAAKK